MSAYICNAGAAFHVHVPSSQPQPKQTPILSSQSSQVISNASLSPQPEPQNWHSLQWTTLHKNVRRLQTRIVKATQQGKWGKVKALQRLLTHSFSAKALAVKRVTENPGKRTAGVDGQHWSTPQKKMAAVHNLSARRYRPRPQKRVLIPKANGKLRPLGILTMHDRAMQVLYLLALDPVAETLADPHSYGFRKDRSCADAIERCFKIFSAKEAACYVLEGDIRACFDEISHQWLLTHVPTDKTILHKWLKAGYIYPKQLFPTDKGTVQGGPISPVLANLTLDGLEKKLAQLFPPTATARGRYVYKVHLVRFADDFIISGSSKQLLEDKVKPAVQAFLAERGLQLSVEKTKLTHIEDGFNFLGQNIRKYPNGKLLIKPSRASVKTFLSKVRRLLKTNSSISAGRLISLLNPVIRGWANYHWHVVNKQTFARVNYDIFQAIWRWIKRRHGRKNWRWCKERYFKSVGLRNWVMFGQVLGRHEQLHEVELFDIAGVPIKRHVQVKSAANPYDPAWEEYFDRRLELKWLDSTLYNRRKLITLWRKQKGNCPVCQEKLTKESGWNLHHIIFRTNGGTDKLINLLLLHPNCHRQVHSKGLKVEALMPGACQPLVP
jgi:RNA-directed DNA polymerase